MLEKSLNYYIFYQNRLKISKMVLKFKDFGTLKGYV
jgi:hypothetical protein